MNFYKCKTCGNIIMFLHDSGVVPLCCGEELTLLKANVTDAATEKHVPVIEKKDNVVKVTVGSVAHPMLEEHYIQWIVLETKKGYQCKFLNPQDAPCAEFLISADDEAVRAYEYCNLHGLWCAEI